MMGEQLTVAQLAERENTTPQVINGWVTKHGLPVVEGAPKRMIDLDVYNAWLKQREGQQRERKTVSAENKAARKSGILPPKTSAIETISKQDRQMLAWSRGEGRGWALAVPTKLDQPFVDDYIHLINDSGREYGTTERRLLQEAKEGKLFFMDPCQVVAFLAGQLAAVMDSDASPRLAEAVQHLSNASVHLSEWRRERTTMSAEEREALLADSEARGAEYEEGDND